MFSQSFSLLDHARPDYFVLDHMLHNDLLSFGTYNALTEYTERPACGYLVPLGHETQEMRLKRERDSWNIGNLAKENQFMKKQKDKRKEIQ
ncbi:hypothetical protein OIDMADRAFT_108461, partial [Oidiodendron maius Zn]